MFSLGLVSVSGGLLHLLIGLFFNFLILVMIVWMLATWLIPLMPQAGGGRFMHFLETIMAPIMDPVRKRMPQVSLGMINVGYTIVFIFVWWALGVLAFLILDALPNGW
ncbi:MAG TPA: YggT family protein [Ktedonobacterales bacterium]|nr:YggT family protein [Ktedonobacterales bacterium]